jgi:2-aminoadipate transaminase
MNAPQRPPEAPLRPAARSGRVRGSIIRELLKLTQTSDVISLAGGLPSPQAFPVDALRAAFDEVLATEGRSALQYSATEGDPQLREWIAVRETARGAPTRLEEVLIVSGSQQALDLIGKALVDPGVPLLVESPTYLGALQAFSVYEPEFRSLPSDAYGLQPAAIDDRLSAGARLLYAMPNFQNPTGRTLSAARREELARAVRERDLWLIEDDPYCELWYDAAPPPSLRVSMPERTIRLSSFSKVLAPGLRLGYVIAPRACIELLARMKQATDLCTATLTQRAAARVLAGGLMDEHLPRIRELYAAQARVMLDALQAHMPHGVTWTRPDGGMFVWLQLPPAMDAMALLAAAIERGVAFVPGEPFYAGEPERNTLRLSFVTVAAEDIRRGVAAIAKLIAEARNAGK